MSEERESDYLGSKNEFGTFAGVFTPAILTILGVIMFMRANFVVGQAGILGALAILLIAKSITFTTALSIGAISTNMQVRGGGSYFLISRVLGAEFGGAIGLALFSALALSVPFYILGFTEALVRSFPQLAPYFQVITLSAALILFAVAFYGADLAIKTQYVIMTFLFLAILAFLGGAIQHFSLERFVANLAAGYTPIDPRSSGGSSYSFWIIFAIYFPAVTGIDAGLNMSGDLKDPARSIPRGTLAAVGVGFMVYLLQIFLDGGAYARGELIAAPFELLRDNALFGLGIAVVLGVVAATLSSALGSYLGAPRVLQAVSRDRIIWFLRYFARGAAKGDEPRRALLFTLLITLAVLLWAGNESGGAALNGIAAVITMFFLYSYGMINLAAFIEDIGDNPSFRPQFKFFHWTGALAGALGCVVVSILVNWLAALAAVILIVFFLWYIKTRHLQAIFGDARRGLVFRALRNNLLRLVRMREDPKNWRPTIIVFSGNPAMREELVTYAAWLEAQRGLVYLAYVMVGDFKELAGRRAGAVHQLALFCEEKNISAFPVAVVADDLEQGVSMVLQSAGVGPVHPNLAIWGWSRDMAHLPSYFRQLRTAATLGMSLVIMEVKGIPRPGRKKRIDVWWRGKKNGELMVLLAYLLAENWEWHDSRIRLIRVVENEAGHDPALESLKNLISAARIPATPKVIISDRPIIEILHEYSRTAACVVLGFDLPSEKREAAWHAMYNSFFEEMPTTLLVHSGGEEDLFA